MPQQYSMFHQKQQPSQQPGLSADVNSVSTEVRELSRRLRTLEERYTNLQTKTHIGEQNAMSRHKRVNVDIKTLTLEIDELKKETVELKDRIILMIKEIQTLAKREDIQVLQKYINIWEPLNFVTRNEVDYIIKDILRKNKIPVE